MTDTSDPPDTSISSGPSGVTQGGSPSFSFTSDVVAGVTFACRLDGPGAVIGAWGVCTSPKALGPLADGDYTFQVRAINGAGSDDTPAAQDFTVDTTAPSAPVISAPAEGEWNASGTIEVSGSAEPGSTVELFEGAMSRETAVADDDGAWSTTLSGVPDGSHTYTAKATDDAGNTSATSGTRTVGVDTNAPDVAVGTPVEGVRVRLGQVVLADYGCTDANLAACSGPVATGAAIDTATPGVKSFTVQAEDEAGNTASETVHYVVDASAPEVTITVPVDGGSYPRGASVNAAWACSDEDGAVDVDASPSKTFGTVAPGGAIGTATLGSKEFSVTCADLAGNVTTKTVEYTVTDPTPPGIAVTVPADGARYQQGQVLAADYACTEEDGGSGVKACSGTVARGAAINTGTPGAKSFVVDAEDQGGNRATRTVHYVVEAPAASPAAAATPPAPQVTRPASAPVRAPSRFALGSARAGAGGILRLTFKVPSAGVLVVRATVTVSRASRTVVYAKARRTVGAGSVKVTLEPTAAGRRLLRRSGELKVQIRSVWTAAHGGAASVVRRSVAVPGTR